MKRNFIKTIVKITGVLFVCSLFASFSPSLDGRAVVADAGVLPEGYFAKTVGYLPGDALSVTNIAGNSTIEILVIGALDPSEGVAILLSPEAAEAIGISKDSNNIVKITKRAGQDERAFGTAMIAKSNEMPSYFESEEKETEPEYEPEDFADESDDEENGEYTAEEFAAEFPAENDFVDDDDYILVENDEVPEEYEETEEPFEDYSDDEEYADDESYEEEDSEEFEDEEEDSEEFEDEEEDFDDEDGDESEFFVADDLEDEDEYDEEEEPFDDEEEFENDESNFEEEYADEEYEDEYLDEYEDYEEEIPEEESEDDWYLDDEYEDEEDGAEKEFLVDDEEESEEFEEAPLSSEYVENDELDELYDEESDEYEYDEYDAIVLVPTDEYPPEVDEEVVIDDSSLEDVAEVEDVFDFTPSYSKTTVTVPETTGFDKYIVKSFDDLKKESYYIQIAVMREESNINDIISKYGKNYPIAIIPKADGNGNYILIGPLNVDEYGAVLARFKAYGYKDAFLRKIK